MKLFFEIFGALIVVFAFILCFSCCVVSGRCSRVEERYRHE